MKRIGGHNQAYDHSKIDAYLIYNPIKENARSRNNKPNHITANVSVVLPPNVAAIMSINMLF